MDYKASAGNAQEREGENTIKQSISDQHLIANHLAIQYYYNDGVLISNNKVMDNTILKELQEIKRYTLLQAKQVLDLDDASLLTGLSKSRLYALTSQGKIPHHKSPEGRNLYFSRDELNAWMLSRHFEGEANMEAQAKQYCLKKKII